jgi:supervillin
VKTQNRRTATSNPIKKLAARNDFTVSSYVEVSPSDTEKDEVCLRQKKPRDVTKSSSFAVSALAGLASQEDFKAIAGKLRSSATTREVWKSYDIPNSSQNVMLVQVKGRRRAQTRLVEPDIKSINSGDCYILVNKQTIFAWIGQYCNVIERTKTLEIANQIQKKKDLCFRSSNDIIIIDHQKENFDNKAQNDLFLKELKSNNDSVNPPKNPEEDEYYEEAIIGTNMIYRVNNEELVPLDNYWGRVPRFEMLAPEEAYVFDFGSEMYVWVGKLASNIKRKCALDSAKDLWNKGYNYSECDINPLGSNVKSEDDKRPYWTWFTKVNQNMESVLFKDKFLDWPSISKVVKSNCLEKDSKDRDVCSDRDICSDLHLSPLNAKSLIETKLSEPDMILENAHLGRGVRWDDEQEGIHIYITTLKVKCWHISEYERHELLNENLSYFYSGDTYVVRWHYRMSRAGRDLKTGNVSRHSMIGRDRCCYFFWHGLNTKNTEKGASALMTVELDSEKAQQVFIQIFQTHN